MQVSQQDAHKEATELIATIQERGEVLHELVHVAEKVKERLKKQEPVEKIKESAKNLDKRLNMLNNKIARIQLATSYDIKAVQNLNRVFNEFEIDDADLLAEIDMDDDDWSREISFDKFQRFWIDSFGVELDDLRWDEFMSSSHYKHKDPDKITARMFRMYLQEQLGMSVKEANFYLRDQKMVKRVNSKQCQTFCSSILFALCFIFLMIMLTRNLQRHGTADRYMTSRGIEQVLVDTVWLDITFADINSVGMLYNYMKIILLPFAYGALEFQLGGSGPESVDQRLAMSPNSTQAMDPFLLGGVQIRQIRYEQKECSYLSQMLPWVGQLDCVSEDVDTAPMTQFVNSTHIAQEIPWRSASELKDVLPQPGWTKVALFGDGHVFHLPPHTSGDSCGEDYSCGYCVDEEYVPEEYAAKSELPWQLCKAYNMLQEMEENAYIDKMTRAIIIDFNTYNPTKTLHTLGRVVFEFRLGTVWPSYNIHTHNFLYYTTKESTFVLVLFCISVFLFTIMHFGEVFAYIQVLGGPMWTKVTSKNRKFSSLNIHILRFIVSERSFKHEWWRMCCGKKHQPRHMDQDTIKFMHYDEKAHLLTIPLLNCTQLQIQKNQTLIVSTVKSTLENKVSNVPKSVAFHHIRTTDYGVVNFVLLVTDADEAEEEDDDTLTDSDGEGSTGFLVADTVHLEPVGIPSPTSECMANEGSLARMSSKYTTLLKNLTVHTSLEKMFEEIGEDITTMLHQDKSLENLVVVVPTNPSICQRMFGLGLLTHYSDLFRWVDLLIIILFISLAIIQGCIITNNNDEYETGNLFDNSQYHSLRNLLSLVYVEEFILFAIMMGTTMKVMDFLSAYIVHFNMFKTMLLNVASTILHFFMLVIWVVFVFATVGWILFSSQLRDFRTIGSSLSYLIRSFVSEIDFEAITTAHPLSLGFVYYFFWIIFITFILVNVFVGIMLTEWEKTVQDSEIQIEHENFSSMMTRLFPHAHKFLARDKMTDVSMNKFKEKQYWMQAYPAGCPKRKLRMYLVSQVGVEEDDVDLVMDLIDRDDSGTIDWDELTSVLLDIKPTIDARLFALRRKQIEAMKDAHLELLEEIKAQTSKLETSIVGHGTKYPSTYKHLGIEERQKVDEIIDAYRHHPKYEQNFYDDKTKEKIVEEMKRAVRVDEEDAEDIIDSISVPTTEFVSKELENLKSEVSDIRSDVREIKELLLQMKRR